MAEEEKEEKQEKKSGSGKGLLIGLILLVVILLGAIGGAGYYLYSTGALEKLTASPDQIDTKSSKKEKDSDKEEEENTVLFSASIKDIVLNITKNNGRNALMKLAFTMKSPEEAIEARVTENNAEIMDAVISIVSTKTAEELRTLGGKEVFKEELLIAINDILNANITEENEETAIKDGVKKLFFVNFVIK
jgi:flagellar FliL protein